MEPGPSQFDDGHTTQADKRNKEGKDEKSQEVKGFEKGGRKGATAYAMRNKDEKKKTLCHGNRDRDQSLENKDENRLKLVKYEDGKVSMEDKNKTKKGQ